MESGACWDIAFTSSETYYRKSTDVFKLLISHSCVPLISFISIYKLTGTCVTHDWHPKSSMNYMSLFYLNHSIGNLTNNKVKHVTCDCETTLLFHSIYGLVVSTNSSSRYCVALCTRRPWGSLSSCTMRRSWAGSAGIAPGTYRTSPPSLKHYVTIIYASVQYLVQ
jgi:hypothetical protein